MFKWLSQFIQAPGKTVLAGVDRINAALQGSRPRPVSAELGTLSVPSRSITLEDPQGMPHGLEIPDLASNTAKFSAELLRYPNFGRKSLDELKGILKDHGLSLRSIGVK